MSLPVDVTVRNTSNLVASATASIDVTSSYPGSVVLAGLQGVWDLQFGETTGYRAANLTKVLGVDSLAGTGMTLQGNFLRVVGSGQTITGWDFSASPGGPYVASGTVMFVDCLFKTGNIAFYGISVEGGNVTCRNCTFDGTNMRAGSSNYKNNTGTTFHLDHCRMVRNSSDLGKSSGTFTATDCYYLCNGNASVDETVHIDFHQMDAGSAIFTRCMFDARGWTGGGFNAAVNNYVRIESNGGVISGCTVDRCIGVGQSESGGLHPFHIAINPNAINNVSFLNSLWEAGAGGQYFYPANTSRIVAWSNNFRYNTGSVYPMPNNTNNPAP